MPGVQLTNISLRMLHADKQSRLQRPLVAWLQRTLRETRLGQVCQMLLWVRVLKRTRCGLNFKRCNG